MAFRSLPPGPSPFSSTKMMPAASSARWMFAEAASETLSALAVSWRWIVGSERFAALANSYCDHPDLLEAYKTWLHMKYRLVEVELSKSRRYREYYQGLADREIRDGIRGIHIHVGESGDWHFKHERAQTGRFRRLGPH